MYHIVGIGELLIDFTPVRKEDGLFFKENPGGAPCNMLAMASAMGAKTAFIGKVGQDQFGQHLKATIESKGIDSKGLILSDTPTTLAFVHLDDQGERSFSFYREGCADVMLEKSEIDFEMIDATQCLHFGSLSFTSSPIRETLYHALEYAKSRNKTISYDPNYRPALWPSEEMAISYMLKGFEYANYVKVSDEEAILLTGEKSVELAAKRLREYGPELICVTLGSSGVYYSYKNFSGYVEGFSANVIDTTGAGDSFFGAFIGQLMLDETNDQAQLESYLKTANAAASVVIESYGGLPSIPSKDTVLKRLNK
jgi:fructokinase